MSEPQLTPYGHITYKRVISDNDHGNVQVERTIPVLIQGQPTPSAILQATTDAWDAAIEQVNEHINRQFELEGMAAPCYDGLRFTVARWVPDDCVLLILPEHSRPPGQVRAYTYGKGRRLDDARRIAARIVQNDPSLVDLVDFSHGDFAALQTRLDDLHAEALTLDPELDEDPDHAF